MATFLLSPANMAGVRVGYLRTGDFALARRFRETGAPIGEVFAFTSGLYFRGKLAYARAFGHGLVITSSRGLLPVDTVIGPPDIEAFGTTRIDVDEPAYVEPLQRDVATLHGDVVLLGSLATPKYVDPLSAILGERLLYPTAFVGQGDMRRGSMMLTAARAGTELAYASWAPRR